MTICLSSGEKVFKFLGIESWVISIAIKEKTSSGGGYVESNPVLTFVLTFVRIRDKTTKRLVNILWYLVSREYSRNKVSQFMVTVNYTAELIGVHSNIVTDRLSSSSKSPLHSLYITQHTDSSSGLLK